MKRYIVVNSGSGQDGDEWDERILVDVNGCISQEQIESAWKEWKQQEMELKVYCFDDWLLKYREDLVLRRIDNSDTEFMFIHEEYSFDEGE